MILKHTYLYEFTMTGNFNNNSAWSNGSYVMIYTTFAATHSLSLTLS